MPLCLLVEKYLRCSLFFALHYAEPVDVLLCKTGAQDPVPKNKKKDEQILIFFLGWQTKTTLKPSLSNLSSKDFVACDGKRAKIMLSETLTTSTFSYFVNGV